MTLSDISTIRFDGAGLVPVVAQDAESGDVLMLAFMNDEALRLTRSTGRAHYWSRSRGTLWRKGETSGNEQTVIEIRVNCERNSLLLLVRQNGAVCHDGFDTCFYRVLGDDDGLQTVRERVFDPETVYGRPREAAPALELLADATRLQFGAYEFLRDHDLEDVSGTSRRLRKANTGARQRVADELEEMAGVLDGDHQHTDPRSDLLLEASQVVYWLLLEVIRAGGDWDRLRPDRALSSGEIGLRAETAARMLRANAVQWRADSPTATDVVADAHATLALVAQACEAGGVGPAAVVEADLAELRTRGYLAPYFAPQAE